MLTLANDVLELALDPGWGARVTSLRDLRSGRDWLVPGLPAGDNGEDAVYGAEQARGWDECFPTVLPCPGEAFGWRQRLRDHGDLWGRPWFCTQEADAITASFETECFRFTRRLVLRGERVEARYAVRNIGRRRFGFLYSQHMLLALKPGETISAAGIGPVSGRGRGPVVWPDLSDLHPVREMEAKVAVKLYAELTGPAHFTASGRDGALTLAWSPQDAPAVGLWLNYGGWPESGPVHQVAIEPTTAPVDALDQGGTLWLEPGQGREWTVTMTLTRPAAAARGMPDE